MTLRASMLCQYCKDIQSLSQAEKQMVPAPETFLVQAGSHGHCLSATANLKYLEARPRPHCESIQQETVPKFPLSSDLQQELDWILRLMEKHL